MAMAYDTSFQKKHGRWLTWLRIATLIPPIIALSLLGWSMTLQQYIYTDGIGGIGDFLPMVPLAFSFCWSLSFLLAALIKSAAAPMHPGFPVGFDFLCWGALIGSGVTANILHIEPDSECRYAQYDMSGCETEKKIVPAERTAAAFLFLDAIFHIILFTAACRACTVLRREKKGKTSDDLELQNKAGSNL